jgi:hypothetical protein
VTQPRIASTDGYLRLPPPYVVPEERVIRWLLQRREHGDRSRWLALGGFTLLNWGQLARALMEQASMGELTRVDPSDWGPVFVIRGPLEGRGKSVLPALSAWVRAGEPVESRFLTAWPDTALGVSPTGAP